MSRKRHRSCKGKTRFRDHSEAVRALHKFESSSRARVPSRAYYCPVCRGFHLTSQPMRG